MIFDGKKIISNETELVEVFNENYIIVVEKFSGKKPRHIARDNNIKNKRIAIQVKKIILKIIQVSSKSQKFSTQAYTFATTYNN